MLKEFIFSLFLMQTFQLFAQQNVDTTTKESTIQFGGYAEMYYSYIKKYTRSQVRFFI